jgi:ribosomal protein S18 acetylase RimI-like enzyme
MLIENQSFTMLSFKKASTGDAKVVSDIVQASFKAQAAILNLNRTEHPNYVAFEGPDGVLKSLSQGETVILGCLEALPVATTRFKQSEKEPECGHISRLAVLPEYRKRGFGVELMDFAQKELKALGVEVVEIEIVAEFDKLRVFYLRQGYSPETTYSVASLPFKIQRLLKKI